MVAIDTNILARLIVRDDEELYTRAKQIVSTAKPATLWLDRLVITELGYVLKSVYNFKKADVVETFKSLLDDQRFYIPDREMVVSAIRLFELHRPLSLVDSWLLALKKSGQVKQVVTFDKSLRKSL